ncbi:DUF3857 domain-containing protein [Rudanella paleaurantiibacter]|uniref:DUF3857 domain-containing protein n=1 Tax=Rudanella paleaurantiibacter TaxID=2614655 RepID=A0A7J5U5H5_9BACT|nr:DUF3857 domain-containing protein [Rudanella paleaurantiibacter]KAB7733094.1 DUF3857 domain-containing protein [Rudanella paleaurantiibacter]
MKKLFLWLLALPTLGVAQDEYRASAIPAPLHTNAHAVIRRHETVFTVKAPGEATHRVRTVVTVLDAKGDDQAQLVVRYDKLSRVDDIWGALYGADGGLIKKLRKADIDDRSAYDGVSFLTDNRLKQAIFPRQPSYPYTVEFVYETTERNLMFYPTWTPQSDENVSLEQATLTMVMPTNMPLRYKEVNMKTPVERVAGNQQTVYRWAIQNQPALQLEPMAPPASELLSTVYTAPTTFEVQGYAGVMQSWRDLGRFYYLLNRDRDQIPDALRQRVVQLTANEPTALGKIKKVYELVQQSTRYVSVQLGIGGWQTIEAGKVADTQYGDCKALTNYTRALLKAAGIPAIDALVRAGNGAPDIRTDFPSFQFNHVILCVPINQDTLYLECTDQSGVMGYNGTFTGGRHVLLVTPDGGKLTQTRHYSPTDNRQVRRIDVVLTADGNATAEARNLYTGIQQESRAQALVSKSQTEQRNWLLQRIVIPNYELTNFLLTEHRTPIPAVSENLTLSVRKWATPSGARLFLPLNLMSALDPVTPASAPRQFELDLDANWDWQDTDTVSYQLPASYTPEFMPAPVSIRSKFGDYTAQVSLKDGRLIYMRQITVRRGRHPASAYAEWVDFRRRAARQDKVQVVLVKQEVATK